jgi:hypothetical protein
VSHDAQTREHGTDFIGELMWETTIAAKRHRLATNPATLSDQAKSHLLKQKAGSLTSLRRKLIC